MANGGYTGKVLHLNLTNKTSSIIDTEPYEEYGGGLGMGSAIIWDMMDDMTIDGFDPKNVIGIMPSPLSGTAVPGGGGSRTEVMGIGVMAYPIGWFTRSSFGGRFAGQLKYAGWDGVIIEGKADAPVWVNIVNDQVTFEDASSLWGQGVFETEEDIWRQVNGSLGEWQSVGNTYSTQRPAVVCIGQAGENLSRLGVLMHDLCAAGQGGFGGIFGSKNLKAISVIGTGSVSVADPQALMEGRLWWNQNFQYNVDDPVLESPIPNFPYYGFVTNSPACGNFTMVNPTERARPQACQACGLACRRRYEGGYGNESTCVESIWYSGNTTRKTGQVIDLAQEYGLNTWDIMNHSYLYSLYGMGVMGAGKAIDTDLPFERYGQPEFAEALVRDIATRTGVGDDLAEGWARASVKWGRYQEDTDSGLLAFPNWGYAQHYDPRLEVEWSYGSIMGDRDINEHCFNWGNHWMPTITGMAGVEPLVSAEELVTRTSKKTLPYTDDPYMWDYSEGPTGIYSDHRAKEIAWHRYYTRFWKQSIGYCDWVWPYYINTNNPDMDSASPEAEPKFFNAVTGKNWSFVDGIEAGRKVWNLHNAIWTLQGRHRDMVVHSGYVYTKPTDAPYFLTVYEDGAWKYDTCMDRVLNKTKFEEWKTKFYDFVGWDTSSGWPTRATLEGLGQGDVADALQAAGKLGS